MPNHIASIITFKCPKARMLEVLRDIKYDAGENGESFGTIDFNKLIPMPENIFRGPIGKKEFELYGKDNWYDWSRDNWGTKWNSYGTKGCTEADFKGKHISFLTAWSPALPVVRALAAKYGIAFTFEYADEDTGYNCGRIVFDGAQETENDIRTGTKEAKAFANRIWAEYNKDGGDRE